MASLCEVLPGVAYPGVLDSRSTLNAKTGYDDDDELERCCFQLYLFVTLCVTWFVSKVARNSFSNRHETFRRDGTVQNNKTFGEICNQ